MVYGCFIGTIMYPVFGNWVWGGGWQIFLPFRYDHAFGAQIQLLIHGCWQAHDFVFIIFERRQPTFAALAYARWTALLLCSNVAWAKRSG